MATLTQSQIYTIALLSGMENPKLMAAIAMAESSGRTDVVNSIGCVGLWQINQPVHVKANPKWTQAWLKNPINNAAAAKKIYASQGLRAWEVYTNGMYMRYMGAPVKNLGGKVEGGQIVNANWWDDVKDLFGPPDLEDFEKGFELGGEAGEAIGEIIEVPGLEGITEGIKATADALVNPRTWLRVGYGVIGIALVVGGLFLITKGTVVQQTVGQVSKAVKKGTS